MSFNHIACAFGKHKVDREGIKRAGGQQFGRCRTCKTPLEETEPHHWAALRVKDAGLGRQAIY
ncbi:hypothetical protein P8Q88_06525 [Qipengyuania sp. XHP0207]|uniref:hypothetical protein n=1 Tax=Qipengyuania sp. XHP0207 TaxID=3038078 RepID=UPI00241F449B|nr:hypothetical protein [Qipengyuania sp. XHP0207]MDG5747830.1 hypothetical protein [Qipengyuania sp. XHP0207]